MVCPILAFTSEEVFSLIDKSNKSIHEMEFTEIPKKFNNNNLENKWKKLYEIKQEANIAIEEKRSSKEIGSSLEAEIEIFTNEENFKLMENLDLPEYFITSNAQILKNKNKSDSQKIIVKKAEGSKCPRCWKILKENAKDVRKFKKFRNAKLYKHIKKNIVNLIIVFFIFFR